MKNMHFIQILSIVLAIFAYNAGIMLIAFAFQLCSNYTGIIGSILYVTRFVKIDPNHTGTEIHFIAEH